MRAEAGSRAGSWITRIQNSADTCADQSEASIDGLGQSGASIHGLDQSGASIDLGGEVDHVLADLHGCGVGHVRPGGALGGARDGAEQPDGGVGAQLGGAAAAGRQRDGDEDGLVELPLPRLHGNHPAHLTQCCHVSRVMLSRDVTMTPPTSTLRPNAAVTSSGRIACTCSPTLIFL